ncbi:hypothetical protein BYT27DRAFT_6552002 [Phlegmacium glaucopus]|nr:hypothetical protein BYT27DRAFT_6552002 [Phlegmacium glaucopus]
MEEGEQDSTRKPAEILDLEIKLSRKRSFNTQDDDPDLSIARSYDPQFESSYIRTLSEDHTTVKSSRDFTFYCIVSTQTPHGTRRNHRH